VLTHCAFLCGLAAYFRRKNKTLAKEGSAAMYGMIATIPDNAIIGDFLIGMFNELYKTKPREDDEDF